MPPANPERQRQLDAALSAYREACARGEHPDAADLRSRYPELAELIDAAPPTVDREPIEPVTLPPRYVDRPTEVDPEADSDRERPGVSLPGYDVLGEIARGGMGVVYRARQHGTNRIVAVKMLIAGVHSRPIQRRRFLAEAEAVGRLAHPNIVQIFEAGERDGLPFYTMEYCAGGSLADSQGGGPSPPALAARLVERIARAVHVLHQNNLIHRDLKPGNVLLAAAEGAAPARRPQLSGEDSWDQWIPKVTDFGLAKNLEADGNTASQAILGTPSYMAPEQAGGKSKHVGPAADVWSLGAILYDLLAGRPPFSGSTQVDTITQVLFENPLPPRRLRSTIPRDLELICLKCLEKEAHDRYHTAEELAEDLRRFQLGQPVTVRPLGLLARTARWCRRNPLVASLVAAVFVALLAGAIVASVFAWQAMERAEAETEAREDAERERTKADSESKKAIDALAKEAMARKNELRQRYFAETIRALRAWQRGEFKDAQTLLERSVLDARGWEYRFVSTLVRQAPLSLGKLEGVQANIVWSLDGRRLACGGNDGNLVVFDTETGKKLLAQRGHRGQVVALAISPDGKHLASASSDRFDTPGGQDHTIKLWEIPGEPIAAPETKPLLLGDHRANVDGLAFSPDGTRLASGGDDKKLIVWDTRTGKPILTANNLRFGIRSLTFSADGSRLITGGAASSLMVWDVTETHQGTPTLIADHTPRNASPVKDPAIAATAVSPTGDMISWGDTKGLIGLWDLKSGQDITVPGKPYPITAMWFTPDRRLVSTSVNGLLRVWDLESDRMVLDINIIAPASQRMRMSVDGSRFAATDKDHALQLWKLHVPFDAQVLDGHTKPLFGVAFTPESDEVVSCSQDQTIRVWNVQSGHLSRILRGHKSVVSSVAVRPDGHVIASASWDRTIKLWNRDNGHLLQTLDELAENLAGVTFSPDGEFLAAVAKGEVSVFKLSRDTETYELWKRIPWDQERLLCVAFHPDGKRLAAGSGKGELRVWALNSDGIVLERSLVAHNGALQGIAYGLNGETIVTAGGDKLVKIWNATDDKPLRVLAGHKSSVNSLAISRDGRRLVSGGSDKIVKIWDFEKGTELHTFREPISEVNCVALSPDGNHVIAGCEPAAAGDDENDDLPDRRLLLWRIPANLRR